MKSKVLVFGGGFNPPTVAHAAIMHDCLRLPDFTELWVMPSGDRIDKHMAVSDRHRLQMLYALQSEQFANEPRLVISDFELALPRPSNTYTTVQALARAYPATEFWFALGPDSYASMPDWPRGRELRQQLAVVLITGPQTRLAADAPSLQIRLDDAYQAVSSTEVRLRCAQGQAITGLVCPSVAAYIAQHHLYER